MATRAAIYCRISRVRKNGDEETLGVDRQEPPCRKLIEGKPGWEVAEVYVDNDLSAFSGKRRPSYERMLADVKAGAIDAVVAWDADRLTRRPIENEGLIDLAERHGLKLATVTGEYDLASPSGRLHFRIKGAVARHESEHRAERLQLKAEELARAGKPHGGRRPFGFAANGLDHDQAEAKAIQEAAARLIAGEPTYAILRDWHERKLTTPGGYRWHATSFRHVMVSPRIAGLREHRGAIVGPAAWEPIIDEATWRQVKDVFADPERRRRQGPRRRYLLTGLGIVCGWPECGKPLIARPAVKADGRSIRQYVCSGPPRGRGCGKLTQYAEPLELYIAERMLDWLAGPGLAAMLAARAADDVDYATLERERAEAERTLDQLSDWLTDGTLDQPRYLRQKQRVTDRIASLDRQLARRPVAPILTDLPRTKVGLVARWDREELEWRRALVAATVEEVKVLPARRTGGGFDADRVRLRFRQHT